MSVSLTNVARWVLQNFYTKTQLTAGTMDTRYFAESEFITTSAGAGDVGKPIKLDAGGHIDATMINDADIDHGTIGGLGDDDHTGYALLAGRSGGQTLRGGTASGDDLIIDSTSNATKGDIILQQTTGNVGVGIAAGAGTEKLQVHSELDQNILHVQEDIAGSLTAGNAICFLRGSSMASTGYFLRCYDGNSGAEVFNVRGDGNVGIGKTPTTALDVNGTVTATAGAFTTATVGGVTVVTTTASQTLTNKTLTTPVISSISNTGTLTLPTSTDTLVGRTTTDTLTNKTLTTPTIGSFTNATHSHQNAAGGGTLDHGLAITGLTDDDHTQYLLLAGRSGGQTFYGDTAANGDLVIHGTSSATKTSSYVSIQPSGGDVVIGGSTTDHNFEVQDAGASNFRITVNLNSSGTNYLNSYNGAVGNLTGAPLAIVGSTLTFTGMDHVVLAASKTPASAAAAGTQGSICWDSSFIYVATGTNAWKRAAISTW